MANNRRGQQRMLRIVGGRWRGRKLSFPAGEDLRPTPDRVRETLFNWLATDIHDAHCLDLFAGSGALGLEALSRGAASCTFVDTARTNCNAITAHLQTLQSNDGCCHIGSAADFLASRARPMDIVFLDPPFAKQLHESSCASLESGGWLSANALIYIESAARDAAPQVPANWRLHRDKQAGEVRFQLFVRDPHFV